MWAWPAPCLEEQACPPQECYDHRGHLGGWPGLALLHWSYSPFWNVVGRNLIGLLGSLEKNDGK